MVRFFLILSGALLFFFTFQNCNRVEFRRDTSPSRQAHLLNPDLSGNGEPFQGKISYYLPARGACGPGIEFKAQIDKIGDEFFLVRENCRTISPKLLAATEISFSKETPTAIVYQGVEFYSLLNHRIKKGIRFDGQIRHGLGLNQKNGNPRKWTVSAWVRRSQKGENLYLLGRYPSQINSDSFTIHISIEGHATVFQVDAERILYYLRTKERIPETGWHHVVVSYDTTQATAEERVHIYVNGVQRSLERLRDSDYPSQNTASWLNNSERRMFVGADPLSVDNQSGGHLRGGGDLADVHLIDGQALPATSFGTFDSRGVWNPIGYRGEYGPNGLRLDFRNPNDLGADVSGNGNHTEEIRIDASNQVHDGPF